MAKPLAQVTDIEALDQHTGSCARLSLTVPEDWGGSTLEVRAPKLLTCDRCDGGGCDSCGRSGALRLPDDEQARSLRFTLPSSMVPNTRIRLPSPFADPSIEQLIVVLRIGAEPSTGITRRLALRKTSAVGLPRLPVQQFVITVALAVLAVLLAAWLAR